MNTDLIHVHPYPKMLSYHISVICVKDMLKNEKRKFIFENYQFQKCLLTFLESAKSFLKVAKSLQKSLLRFPHRH